MSSGNVEAQNSETRLFSTINTQICVSYLRQVCFYKGWEQIHRESPVKDFRIEVHNKDKIFNCEGEGGGTWKCRTSIFALLGFHALLILRIRELIPIPVFI